MRREQRKAGNADVHDVLLYALQSTGEASRILHRQFVYSPGRVSAGVGWRDKGESGYQRWLQERCPVVGWKEAGKTVTTDVIWCAQYVRRYGKV